MGNQRQMIPAMPYVTKRVVRRGVNPDGNTDLDSYLSLERNYENTPNFRALRSAGIPLPENSFFTTVWKPYSSKVKMTTNWSSPPSQSSLTWSGERYLPVGLFFTPQGVIDSLTFQVQNDLISKAKGSQFNAPVFLAEGKKTAAMVASRAEHLVKMLVYLRKGDIVNFSRMFHSSVSPSRRRKASWKEKLKSDPTNAAANIWLEASYGWTPFVLEVQSAVNTLMDVVDRPENRVMRVRSNRSSRMEIEGSADRLFSWGVGYYEIFGKPTSVCDISVRAKWSFEPLIGDLPGKFGLTNPLEVAWELVPLSFVADWFLPIGDYLSALDAPFRFRHVSGSVGYRISEDTSYSPTYWYPYANSSVEMFMAMRSVRAWRRVLTSVPVPNLLDIGFLGGGLGVNRVVSSISLLRQQLNRLSKR